MQHHAPVVYAYKDIEHLINEEESGSRNKRPLPGSGDNAPTERPEL